MDPAYDVFLSYAREDTARAALVRDKLEALGLNVFFDAEGIDSGEEFPIVIDRAVKSAKCVLALWTRAALARRWVRIESRIGLDQSKLVAAMLDRTRPEDLPAEFYNVNFEPLFDFHGSDTHPGWRRVLRAIARRTGRRDLIGDDPSPQPSPATPPPTQTASPQQQGWMWGAGLIAAGALVLLFMPKDERAALQPAPVSANEPFAASAPMMQASLSGEWQGEFWGPNAQRTQFNAVIQEAGGVFSGSLSEPNTFAIGAGGALYANLSGAMQENGQIAFSKTYDGTGGVSHTVYYEGIVDQARTTITGTWRIDSNSGEFRMQRR